MRLPVWQLASLPVLAFGGPALIPACTGSAEPVGEPCTPDSESIRAKVFQKSCSGAGCHDASTAEVGLDFVSGEADALVGKSSVICEGFTLVVPGSPETSFLYQKLTSTMPACGEHMPLEGSLPAADLECVADWIISLAGNGCETCGGDACVSLATDRANCGACGNACPGGVACQNGTCTCPEGTAACGGSCVDVMQDVNHCGNCATVCSLGASCNQGQCSCPDPLSSRCSQPWWLARSR